jgi:4,5-DOPA dioxygenase extradiol
LFYNGYHILIYKQVVTAHWIGDQVLISSGQQPSLYFDYSGFPEESYRYSYNAPGCPELADRISGLLEASSIPNQKDSKRGWDHGVFVPLMLLYPEANIPVVALSLHRSFDPDMHIRIGEAIAPLRKEGVLIIGSGYTFHNFDYFFARGAKRSEGLEHSKQFNNALVDALTNPSTSDEEKREALRGWSRLPSARACHPDRAEEHLIPLHVIAGAGLSNSGDNRISECRLVGPPSLSDQFAVSNFEWR